MNNAYLHHMNWDDLRFFLAVAESGSIRAAAKSLKINHSTVSRRISNFEEKLGARLFERFATGYVLTDTGEDILQKVLRIEGEVSSIDRQVAGRDTELKGTLRVTVPGLLISNWLMPIFSDFTSQYPGIELELTTSYVPLDLAKREADVAIRITDEPPQHLIGRKIAVYSTAIYASKKYIAKHDLSDADSISWVGWDENIARPQWILNSDFPNTRVWHQINDPVIQLEAAKAGMGLVMIPCFLGDVEPLLQRVSQGLSEPKHDVWILSHSDLRNTARVRTFTRFVAEATKDYLHTLEGNA